MDKHQAKVAIAAHKGQFGGLVMLAENVIP
jgi:hypothetical protein